MSYELKTGRTYLKASTLAALLLELPLDVIVECNEVGNLRISDADDNYLGYVDLNEESVEWNA